MYVGRIPWYPSEFLHFARNLHWTPTDRAMSDIFEALEKQQAAAKARGTVKLAPVSANMLAVTARQYFKTADFTGSGRIDDDECFEALDQVAVHGGFTVPSGATVRALFAQCSTRKGSLTVDEFVTFVKMVASGEEPAMPLTPTPPAAPPSPSPAAPPPPPAASPPPAPPHATPPPLMPPSTATGPSQSPAAAARASAPPQAALAPVVVEEDGGRRGRLRVQLVELDGLPARDDGSARQPYAMVALIDGPWRRTRCTDAPEPRASGAWAAGAAVEFERASAEALLVVDVKDSVSKAAPKHDGAACISADEIVGKAVVSLSECRPGVPHVFIVPLLAGQLVLQLHFDLGRAAGDYDQS